MRDDYLDQPTGALARRRKSGRLVVIVLAVVAAIVLGGAAALWGGRTLGWLDFSARAPLSTAAPVRSAPLPKPVPAAADGETAEAVIDVRLAELEQRMTRLGLQAEAASGNAARAEGLLIAFAARRAVERGARLGYLEDQLKVRFGNAQPNAVDTLIEAAATPVTLDILEQGLAALAPTLVGPPRAADTWSRLRSEIGQLFVLRRVNAPSPAPERRLERARRFLESGRVDAAAGEVARLPGAAAARDWLAQAQRYVRAQRALDLIETAAILEPRHLQDGSGAPIATP
ncbi:MAG: mitofilin family membrane protein, partial [Novosphingobium sp.]